MDPLGVSISEGESWEVLANAEDCSIGSGNRFAMETDIPTVQSSNLYNNYIVPYERQYTSELFPRVQQKNHGFRKRIKTFGLNIIHSLSNFSATSSSNYEHQSECQDSKPGSNLKTLEALLYQFGKPTLLGKLEKSLENVKRNKISAEDHNQLVRREDKELQKMSLKFHPDHAGIASHLDAAKAHELQSALNATRTVLKLLTESFLENISFEYRYEYFSKLDISLLANEDVIHKRIQAVLFKICELSEIKRMNIVGETRKFLVECQNAVKSYLERNGRGFVKYSKHALYHLQKNIEGYNKLVDECRILIEECSAENDENMGSIMLSVIHKSLNEACNLSALERVAKCSFRGKFEIFPVDKTVDEYYILPFVNYVNVLSMCNLILLSESCSCIFSHGSLSCGPVRHLFSEAYNLAFDIYHDKLCSVRDKYDLNIWISKTGKAKEDLNTMLGAIFKVLEKEFLLENYKEGKSNNAEMYEDLLSLKKFMEDLEEKEKTDIEHSSRIETDRERNWNSQKMKASDINNACSTNCDKNVSEKFAVPDLHSSFDTTDDFTDHGNLSQGSRNDCDSIFKRKENETKSREENFQSMEEPPTNVRMEHSKNVGSSANDKKSYLYDVRAGKKN